MNVEYSMIVHFKSGRVWSSDPVPTSWDTAQRQVLEDMEPFDPSNTNKVFSMIRNGRIVWIVKDAVEAIEFAINQEDDNATS